jgi:hypothetical protein
VLKIRFKSHADSAGAVYTTKFNGFLFRGVADAKALLFCAEYWP